MASKNELATEFLKVASKNKTRKKHEEQRKTKQAIQQVKKQIKITERTMKKSIMERPEKQEKPMFHEEKQKINEMSELVVHSQQGIKKISSEFEKPSGKILEEQPEPEAVPKAITAEKVLEIPLPPSFRKKELQIDVPSTSTTFSPSMILPDFGKLNEIIKSPTISIIQCDGKDEEIKITRNGKIEKTGIKLDEQDIKSIIKKFADRAGLGITQPIFKATFSNLELTAIISDFSGNRFLIKKN